MEQRARAVVLAKALAHASGPPKVGLVELAVGGPLTTTSAAWRAAIEEEAVAIIACTCS